MRFLIIWLALIASLALASDFKNEPDYVIAGQRFTLRYCSRLPHRRVQNVNFFIQEVRPFLIPNAKEEMIKPFNVKWHRPTITLRQCWFVSLLAPYVEGTFRIVARRGGKRLSRSDRIEVIKFDDAKADAHVQTDSPASHNKKADAQVQTESAPASHRSHHTQSTQRTQSEEPAQPANGLPQSNLPQPIAASV